MRRCSAVVGPAGAIIIPLIVAIRFTYTITPPQLQPVLFPFLSYLCRSRPFGICNPKHSLARSTFGSCNGSILTGARVIFASARDGQLPCKMHFFVLIIIMVIIVMIIMIIGSIIVIFLFVSSSSVWCSPLGNVHTKTKAPVNALLLQVIQFQTNN